MPRYLRASISGLVACLVGGGHVAAQPYPSKPVRVVIVFAPGGSNDIVGRIVFQKMSELMGQPFVIENRAGAGGTVGANLVAKSPSDGYTIMVQAATHVANPHLYKKLPYDTLNDFIGLTTLARQVGILVVHPSMPVRNVRELVALAKARPGEINYGSSGNASYTHLTIALFTAMTGTRMVHLPYNGGGPSAIAIIAGETQVMIHTIGAILPYVAARQVRPIGVTSEARVRQFPDVPSIGATVPGYEFTSWVGSFVPAKTPAAIVNQLNSELKRALEHPDVAKKLIDMTLDPWHMTLEQFAVRLKSDYDKHEKIVRLSGAKVE